MFKKTVILTVGLLLLAGFSGWAEGSQEASEQEGPVTVTVWNWSQENQEFFNEMAAQFNERHSGIQVQFETYVQDQYQQTLPLALKGGKGPDIFWLAPENNPRRFIQQDWIQPVGSYLSDSFLDQFDDRLFVEGVLRFNDQLYTLPFENRFVKMNGLFYYNKDVFEKAGLDPETDVPRTFSELREVSRKITEAGNGKYYAIAWPGNPGNGLSRPLNGFFTSATPASGDVRYGRVGYDYASGEFVADNRNHVEVYELLKGLIEDGSVAPGWSSMKKGAARTLFGQGKIAFYLDGTWMPRVWADMGFPDLNFGIAPVPAPDEGRRAYRYMSLAKGSVYMSNYAENPEATAEVFQWLHSSEFQKANFEKNGVFPGNTTVNTDDATWYQERFLEIADQYVRTHPEPVVTNPDAGQVTWPDVSPNLFEIFAASLQKDVSYYREQAAAWNDKMARQLERNIQKAKDNGADVSKEDFVFPDWNPMEDYEY